MPQKQGDFWFGSSLTNCLASKKITQQSRLSPVNQWHQEQFWKQWIQPWRFHKSIEGLQYCQSWYSINKVKILWYKWFQTV